MLQSKIYGTNGNMNVLAQHFEMPQVSKRQPLPLLRKNKFYLFICLFFSFWFSVLLVRLFAYLLSSRCFNSDFIFSYFSAILWVSVGFCVPNTGEVGRMGAKHKIATLNNQK